MRREMRHSVCPGAEPLTSDRGAALVISLLALIVLFLLGLAFLTLSKTESDISLNHRDAGRALYIADAGLERFKRDLRYDYTYPGTHPSDRYLASPALAAEGTLEDATGTFVGAAAPVKRYYDLGTPLSTTFINLTAYRQVNMNGGSYALRVKKDVDGGFIVESTGSVGNRVSRTLEAKLEPKSLSIWDNAIFGGTGASGGLINGNVTIAGSVHVLGTGLSSSDTAIELGGGANVLNRYEGIAADLDEILVEDAAAIDARPGKLRAEYRVRRGKTSIGSMASAVGQPTCHVKAVYTNDGFAGSNPHNVYSDNGKNMKYDLPSDIQIVFPPIHGGSPPLSSALDITASLPASGANRRLDADTASFGPLFDANGNSITWSQSNGRLSINGVVKVTANLDLAKKNAPLQYVGKGTLYATGSVYLHDDVLPPADSFPTVNCLGIIAGQNIELATGGGESHIRTAGAFYAANRISSGKQTQHAGTFVANYFDMGSQVPRIYQVPLLEKNLPPGLPGGDPYYFVKTVYWKIAGL
ncbi:MAG: PilX N-terminal domain-containing pilus assembly protein [candidate division NC10 bacterium]|nr:PilX N-terminal domain-containing pilus assembly protein [candidate division NC10 bacterium]